MLLSIIIPVYNMAADNKLKHCLDSCLNQSIEKYEIIAVDDASTDDSLSILKEYEAEYPGIVKVIASERNLKQGGAKNLGLNAASGKWVGFVDSDDFISTKNLFSFQAKVIKDLVQTESCIIIGRCANYLLKDNPNVVRLFVCADEDKSDALMKVFDLLPASSDVAAIDSSPVVKRSPLSALSSCVFIEPNSTFNTTIVIIITIVSKA